MKLRAASLLTVLLLGAILGCKKTNDPVVTPVVDTTPTSMVGTWKVSALTFDPAWTRTANGTTERYTDYVQFLKKINETCLTDVTWTFADGGRMTTNVNSVSTCGANGPNSTFIINYLVDSEASYVEKSGQVELRGKGNITSLVVNKTFAADNLVSLRWQEVEDISSQKIPTTYTLVLKKQ